MKKMLLLVPVMAVMAVACNKPQETAPAQEPAAMEQTQTPATSTETTTNAQQPTEQTQQQTTPSGQ
jgi:nitrous oxide reductase accessory protein NosL